MKSYALHQMQALPMTLGDPLPLLQTITISTFCIAISKHKRNSLWSFSPTSELRIISRRHVDRSQVLSTVDQRPSLVDHTHHPAWCTAHDDDWVWRTRRAVRWCQSRLVSAYRRPSHRPRCVTLRRRSAVQSIWQHIQCENLKVI